MSAPYSQRPITLTPREREVLELTWDGLTMKEIAVVLGLATKSVRNVRLQLGARLGARNVVQLVRRGLAMGWLK